VLVAGGAGLLAVVGLAVLLMRGGASAPGPATADPMSGTLIIRSQPAGAQVIVDGDPSGLATPANVTGLRAGRSVEVRVEKSGYAPRSRRLEVKPGAPTVHDFELVEDAGTLVIQDLPAGASVFVDDAAVEVRGPITLPLGPHRVRVETPEELLFSADIVVQRGEQTVNLAPSRRGP
jgi:hypothetical protein